MSISAAGVDALERGIAEAIEEAGLTSCQFALAHDGEIVATETFGAPDDARYLMMSSTKPLVASIVWQLIGEGLLDPSRPVATWWPEFAANGKDAVTLEQVMIHTAGFPDAPLSEGALFDRDIRRAEMEAWNLAWTPGSQWAYHGVTAHWVLAELIQRVSRTDHRAALRHRVLDPLGLDRIELGVPPEHQGDVQQLTYTGTPATPAEIEAFLGVPLSQLVPTSAAPAQPDLVPRLGEPEIMAVGIPGGGGVADAASVALLYQHFLHDPKGLWDPAVLADAKTNVRNLFPDALGRRAYRTLGFETAGDDDKAHLRLGAGATSPAAFGHAGAGGQITWADPATGLSFAFFTNCFDVHMVRMYKRDFGLTRLAAACAS